MKNEYVRFRIDENEKKVLEAIILKAGINKSDFFRQVISKYAKFNIC